MSAAMDKVLAILRAKGSRREGGKWTCPAHDDEHPSLSVSEGDDGRVLLKCHAGCLPEQVLNLLGLEMKDLFVPSGGEWRSRKRSISAVYEYTDEDGKLLFEVCRFEPKDFRQRRLDGRGKCIWNLQGTRRVLYRLPSVLRAVKAGETIYIVEGEKDVATMEKAGVTATCNPFGAGKWRNEYSSALAGARCRIIADDDQPGRKHAFDVARSLGACAETVELLLPATGGDPTEHFEAGLGLDEFVPFNDERDANRARSVLISAPQTDLGNAERLEALFGEEIRFCFERGWLVWDGTFWETDPGPLVQGKAAQTLRRTYEVAPDADDRGRRLALAGHAIRSESASRIAAAVTLARSLPSIQVRARELDADPWLLNTPSGIVDLKTGTLLPHDSSRLCTKITGVPYDSDASCPRWQAFLQEVFSNDPDLVEFFQRACGYTLTGLTTEQVLFYLWGAGANGKTVILETLRYVHGTYAQTAPMALWLSDRSEQANAPTPHLAALHGARFVTSIESSADRRLNEGLVKGVTGGDRVIARELYGRPFEFSFTGKLFCASNHRPVIRGVDEGIWRRILLIPFTRTFAPDERDKHLSETLRTEGPGILRWAVDGALKWQEERLGQPECVRVAVEEYRTEQDRLGEWIEDRCLQDANLSCPTTELFADYGAWAQKNKEEAMSLTSFGKALGDRGFRASRTKRTRLRQGIALSDRPAQVELLANNGDGGAGFDPDF